MLVTPSTSESSLLFSQQAADFLTALVPHMRRLLTYARYLAGSRSIDAEELLHDTILLCHSRILKKGFQGEPDACAGYLCVAMKGQHQESIRQATGRRTRRGKTENVGVGLRTVGLTELLLAQACERPDITIEAELDPVALAAAVHMFLSQHYTPEQVAVWEYYTQGVSFEEIAFLTSFSRSSAHRLVKKIKPALQEEFGHWLLVNH